MFKDASSPIGEDLIYPFVYLSKFAKAKNIKVSTVDTEPLENFDAIVFLDFPTFENRYFRKLISDKFENLYLLIYESKLIRPDNWNRKYHRNFKKIFTWNDDFVDGKKYVKYYWPNKIPENLNFDLSKKNKLCTMIASNKFKSHPLELYTERVKAIRWLEQNHPEDFDLYGFGWDRFSTKLLKPEYPSYKGSVKSKKEIYEKYKFAICYENAKDIPGYTTEKIFDCFFAGCVPVYWGAPNITEYIPIDTFVDRRNFKTYEELYSYLKNMPNQEYLDYLNAIKIFIKSDKMYKFGAECFAKTLIQTILGEHYHKK